MTLFALLLSSLVAQASLPQGYDKTTWGMTVEQVRKVADIEKVHTGDGFNYAEHMEEDPEVYVSVTDQHERIEFYFFEGRLYKIFIIYDKVLYHTGFYSGLVDEVTAEYGPPHRTYEESFFDLMIQHTLWEDPVSDLDIRKGAGFIYQVRIDRTAAEQKAARQKKKKGV